ncbi:MAG: AsmA family protein [Nitrososphaera sp.]|nr:AsmA family protein [Nitrososphaera sp.]
MGRLIKLIVVVGVLAVVLTFAKNIVAKAAVTSGVKALTGLRLNIDRMDIGIVRSAIGINGLRLYNPEGFAEPLMVHMPEIYVSYDLGAFLKRRIHLREVRLDLQEFTVVKNADGALNLDALPVIQETKEQKKKEGKEEPKPVQKTEIQIDALHLQIGKVVYKDYSKGTPPQVREFAVNINEQYQNITNPYVLAGLIVTRALIKTDLARLINIDLQSLQNYVGGTLMKATEAVGDAAKTVEGLTKQLQETSVTEWAGNATSASKQAVGTARDAVKGTAESLKKMLPIGDR